MRVVHTLEPIYDKASKILILGTMPSVKSREQAFYYAHPQNRFWKIMAQLFECSIDNISLHLKNIFKDGELVPEAVIEESSATASASNSPLAKIFFKCKLILSVEQSKS